jgi:hypothetical protein
VGLVELTQRELTVLHEHAKSGERAPVDDPRNPSLAVLFPSVVPSSTPLNERMHVTSPGPVSRYSDNDYGKHQEPLSGVYRRTRQSEADEWGDWALEGPR